MASGRRGVFRTNGNCKCPKKDCSAAYDDPDILQQHLVNHHKRGIREAWEATALMRPQGDDLEKFKADFEALGAKAQ